MSESIIKNLKNAAELILEKGWTRGSLLRNDGCMCALGAIGMAVTGDAQEIRIKGLGLFSRGLNGIAAPEADEVAKTILLKNDRSSLDDAYYGNVYEFNDDPARVVEDVIVLFEETIARLEKELLVSQLQGTKEALIKHGRGIGRLEDSETGALCLLGGVSQAITGSPRGCAYERTPVLEALAEVIKANNLGHIKLDSDPVTQLVYFNDRTRDDEVVYGVIDAAIAQVS